jgi:ABC-type dipeptide/oligopeptide/nickel transport system permease component
MARFIVARLFSAILLFFAVTLFVFIVFFVMPQPQIRQLGRGGGASEYDIHNALQLHGTLPDQYARSRGASCATARSGSRTRTGARSRT